MKSEETLNVATDEVEKYVSNSVLHKDVKVVDGKYGSYQYNPNSNTMRFTALGNAVEVKEVLQNITTGEIVLRLEFDDVTSIRKTIDFPRKNIAHPAKIVELAAYGVQVDSKSARFLQKSIENSEATAPVTLVHTGLGWATYQGEKVFLGYRAVGVDSTYNGPLDLAPGGTYKGWLKLVEQHILGNKALETALSIGFSSIVYGFFEKELQTESLFVHFVGNSTTGKTTAASLAVSVGGYSDFDRQALGHMWTSTDNSLIRFLCGNHGLSVLIDEASTTGFDKNKTAMLYTLTSGREKGRLNKELEQVNGGTWSTTIISTGEFSLLSKASQNTGLRMRVFEFHNVKWTTDAKSADAIKRLTKKHYGHAANALAEKLLEADREWLLEKWKFAQKVCLKVLEDNKFADRLAKRYGLIVFTAILVRELLGIQLYCRNIVLFLAKQQDDDLASVDIGERAKELLLQQVQLNKEKFEVLCKGAIRGYSDFEPKGPVWGKWELNEPYDDEDGYQVFEKYLIISTTKFDELLSKCGFEEPKVVLHSWRESGDLVCEKDRFARREKVSFNGQRINVYVIDYTEYFEYISKTAEDKE